MNKANIFEVKAKLSEYVDRAARGERIIICRHNKPVAEMHAVSVARLEPRPVGPLPGRPAFDLQPSFFEPLTNDELDLWDGVAPALPTSRVRGTPGRPAARVAEEGTTYGQTGRRPSAKRRRT